MSERETNDPRGDKWDECGLMDDGQCSMAGSEPTTVEVWRGNVSLYWRTDCFGRRGRALYVGGLNIGHIMTVQHPDYGKTDTPWRAWIMTDEDGKEVGWFPTEHDAKNALADAAAKELCK